MNVTLPSTIHHQPEWLVTIVVRQVHVLLHGHGEGFQQGQQGCACRKLEEWTREQKSGLGIILTLPVIAAECAGQACHRLSLGRAVSIATCLPKRRRQEPRPSTPATPRRSPQLPQADGWPVTGGVPCRCLSQCRRARGTTSAKHQIASTVGRVHARCHLGKPSGPDAHEAHADAKVPASRGPCGLPRSHESRVSQVSRALPVARST